MKSARCSFPILQYRPRLNSPAIDAWSLIRVSLSLFEPADHLRELRPVSSEKRPRNKPTVRLAFAQTCREKNALQLTGIHNLLRRCLWPLLVSAISAAKLHALVGELYILWLVGCSFPVLGGALDHR
jgi:hypothetical protein